VKTALGYIRVSTEEQSRGGVSLGMQESKIRAYCKLHDLNLVGIYGDPGISGGSVKGRPGIQTVLELVRKKRIDSVVVYKLDRLARNTLETEEMLRLMDSKRVALHSFCEKLDTRSATGRFFVRMLASLAEMERELISERTVDALASKREKGERVSRYAPFGSRFEGDRVVPEPREQAVIRTVRKLSADGHTVREIGPLLAKKGILNRKGREFKKTQIHRLLQAA